MRSVAVTSRTWDAQIAIAYLYCFPFTSAFAPNRWLPISLILALLCLVVTAARQSRMKLPVGIWLALLFQVFTAIGFGITLAFNLGTLENKNLSYVFALVTTSFLYFLPVAAALSTLDSRSLSRHLYWSVVLQAGFACMDLLVYLVIHVKLGALVPIPDGYKSNYGGLAGIADLFRVKGFFLEPAYFAWFLVTAGVLVLASADLSQRQRLAMRVLLVLDFILSASTGAALGLTAGFVVFLIYKVVFREKLTWKIKPLGIVFSTILVGGMVWIASSIGNYLSAVVTTLSRKLALQGVSAQDRTERFQSAIDQFVLSPLYGFGFGYTSSTTNTGNASYYLTLLSDTGVLGLGLYLSQFVVVVVVLLSYRQSIHGSFRSLWIVAFVGCLTMLTVTDAFYYSWVWLIPAVLLSRVVRAKNDSVSTFNSEVKRS